MKPQMITNNQAIKTKRSFILDNTQNTGAASYYVAEILLPLYNKFSYYKS